MSYGTYSMNIDLLEQALEDEMRRLSNLPFHSIFNPTKPLSEFRRAALGRLMFQHGFVPVTEPQEDVQAPMRRRTVRLSRHEVHCSSWSSNGSNACDCAYNEENEV